MKYRVTGADRSTGQDVAGVVEANTRADAQAIANRSMLVADVELDDGRLKSGALRTCENCGGTIGKLEPRRDWKGSEVCGACLTKLEVTMGTGGAFAAPTKGFSLNAPATNAKAKGPPIICPNPHCGYRGPSLRKAKGSRVALYVLILLFIIPGILYMIFYSGYRLCCPVCGVMVREE